MDRRCVEKNVVHKEHLGKWAAFETVLVRDIHRVHRLVAQVRKALDAVQALEAFALRHSEDVPLDAEALELRVELVQERRRAVLRVVLVDRHKHIARADIRDELQQRAAVLGQDRLVVVQVRRNEERLVPGVVHPIFHAHRRRAGGDECIATQHGNGTRQRVQRRDQPEHKARPRAGARGQRPPVHQADEIDREVQRQHKAHAHEVYEKGRRNVKIDAERSNHRQGDKEDGAVRRPRKVLEQVHSPSPRLREPRDIRLAREEGLRLELVLHLVELVRPAVLGPARIRHGDKYGGAFNFVFGYSRSWTNVRGAAAAAHGAAPSLGARAVHLACGARRNPTHLNYITTA